MLVTINFNSEEYMMFESILAKSEIWIYAGCAKSILICNHATLTTTNLILAWWKMKISSCRSQFETWNSKENFFILIVKRINIVSNTSGSIAKGHYIFKEDLYSESSLARKKLAPSGTTVYNDQWQQCVSRSNQVIFLCLLTYKNSKLFRKLC